MVALLLLLIGIPQEAITYDYALSDEGLRGGRKEKETKEYFKQHGLASEFASTAGGLVDAVADHLDSKYGGV